MAQLRILKWHAALFGIVEPEEIQNLFSAALKRMPMTHEELAQRLGVSQPTVSRWTSGAATPALSEMRRTIQVVADEAAQLHVFVSKLNEILQRVERLDGLLQDRDPDAPPARRKARKELLGLLGGNRVGGQFTPSKDCKLSYLAPLHGWSPLCADIQIAL